MDWALHQQQVRFDIRAVLLDIFYVSNFGSFDKVGVFQQPRLITTVDRVYCSRKSRNEGTILP
jgi:hypothetical protein